MGLEKIDRFFTFLLDLQNGWLEALIRAAVNLKRGVQGLKPLKKRKLFCRG
jgi:hypothetical protein